MPQDMFTPEEAFSFVAERLKVKNARERMTSDKRGLLDEIVAAMQTELPFHNINLLRISPENRRRPTLEEIKADIISGIGGLCYGINVASFYILKALGYDAVMVHGTCTSSVMFPDNHINVHVRHVEKPGDVWLVETGFGFPTFRAISLDFEKESPAYRDSFIEYKYMKHEGKILRMHRQGDLAPRSNLPEGVLFVLDGWRRFYFTETTGTTNIEDFNSDFESVFTNPKGSPFHLSLRVLGFPGKRAVMVVNDKTLIENDSGDLVSTVIPGGDEGIIAEVKRLFPIFPEESIKDAVLNWRKSIQS